MSSNPRYTVQFVSGRMANSDSSVTSVFVVMHSPEKNGALGLLEAVNKTLDLTGGKGTKLVGVTTDGESANTGRHGGLWRLLADQVQRGLATFWCAAHRSDLAIESVVSTVPELGIWKSNLQWLVRFFRTPRRMKMLSAQAGNVKQFPRHHDVRFAQLELQLVDAVLNNLPTCIKVWEQMQPPESTSDRKEKSEAKGFLRIWNHQQKWITSLTGDILEIFETLQKKLQRSDLFISDLLTVTGAAVKKLRLMRDGPFPGRREEKESCPTDSTSEDLAQRKSNHQFVCTNRRNARAIRLEVVQASHEYLSERIHPEQEDVIKDMKGLVISRNLGSFVEHGVRVVRRLFPDEASDFADGAAEQCENMMNVPFLTDGCDLGCKMTVRLRQLLPVTTGLVQKVLASLACMSPHSMQTERIVSHHNLVVDNHRTSMGEDMRNARLIVALNIVGTAYFDPRPALVKFPEKTRRWGLQIWTSTAA